MQKNHERPEIQFIPMSTDPGKIRFFGTLMPALLLLKASPMRFLQYQVQKQMTPRREIAAYITGRTDDAGRVEDVLVFVHRWHSLKFDPFTFAQAKTFLARITRMVRRQGYSAEPFDPLSPDINLPQLAEKAGLGNLSPYGLLVHARYGPRVILTGLRTNFPLELQSRWPGAGCNDCLSCVKVCPQKPAENGVINLRLCQSCAKCLEICPTGKKLLSE